MDHAENAMSKFSDIVNTFLRIFFGKNHRELQNKYPKNTRTQYKSLPNKL